jgi:AhpD family alkylhydroperoxidase
MPRIPVHSVDSAPEASRDKLKALEARVGKVLNIHGAMAHSPAVLNAYAALNQAVDDHSSLDSATREAIALAVGAVNACDHCQAAHTGLGRAAGLDAAQMIEIRRGAVSEPRLAALITLVREATEQVGDVSDETWQAALDAGWTARQLADAFASVAANLFTNFFNHYVRTELDLPAAPALS